LVYQYLNPNLYVANPLGTFGNAAHNSLRGPSYTERIAIQPRAIRGFRRHR
jgi:hypothetical protein